MNVLRRLNGQAQIVETVDGEGLDTDWGGNVTFRVKYAKNRKESFGTLVEFREMLDGRLSSIYMARHRMERTVPERVLSTPLRRTMDRKQDNSRSWKKTK